MSSMFTKARDAVAGAGRQVLESPLREITGIQPLLIKAGFALRSIEVELGITPKLSVAIDRRGGDTQALQALLERGDLSGTQRVLISGIQSAFSMEAMALRNDFRVGGLKIGVGLPPSVSIFLVPVDPDHDHLHSGHGPEMSYEQPGVGELPSPYGQSSLELALPILRSSSSSSSQAPEVSGPRKAKRSKPNTSSSPSNHTANVNSRKPLLFGCLFLLVGLTLAVWALVVL